MHKMSRYCFFKKISIKTGNPLIHLLIIFLLKTLNSNNIKPSKKRVPRFPCKLNAKNVSDNDDRILYDLCQTWVPTKHNHPN